VQEHPQFDVRSRDRGRELPSGHGLRPEGAQGAAGDQVALGIEGVVDGGVQGDETLGRAWSTDLPITDTAVERLRWYAMRWRVEAFHKILKSGCKVETARLRTAERLMKLIAVLCIVGWRVFWLRMMNRIVLDAELSIALIGIETAVLDRIVPGRGPNPSGIRDLASYVRKIARLGGWLARAGDPPPGDQVLWAAWRA
jgi:hypothetical protein